MSLIAAHNHQTGGHSNLENVLEIEQLREAVETCNQLSASGWREAPQNIAGSLVSSFECFCIFLIRKCNSYLNLEE